MPGFLSITDTSSFNRCKSEFAVCKGNWTAGSDEDAKAGASFPKNPSNVSIIFLSCLSGAFLFAGSSYGYEFTEAVWPGGGARRALEGGAKGLGPPSPITADAGPAFGTFTEGVAPD